MGKSSIFTGLLAITIASLLAYFSHTTTTDPLVSFLMCMIFTVLLWIPLLFVAWLVRFWQQAEY
jgi:hypothetical protein